MFAAIEPSPVLQAHEAHPQGGRSGRRRLAGGAPAIDPSRALASCRLRSGGANGTSMVAFAPSV